MKLKRTIILLATLFLLVACKTEIFESTPSEADITIDGDDHEWQSNLYNYREKGFSLDFNHNKDFLYIRFVSMDRNLQKLLFVDGFTLWLENPSNKEKLGIKLDGIGNDNSKIKQDFGQNEMSEKHHKHSLNPISKIAIFNNETSEFKECLINQLLGLEIAKGEDMRAVIYEFKIPITPRKEFPVCLALDGESSLKFQFETNSSSHLIKSKIPEMNTAGDRGSERENGQERNREMDIESTKSSISNSLKFKGIVSISQ